MKELKVGERVTITLEAVEHNGCTGCFFNVCDFCYANKLGFKYGKDTRSDHKNVIFKQVKE